MITLARRAALFAALGVAACRGGDGGAASPHHSVDGVDVVDTVDAVDASTGQGSPAAKPPQAGADTSLRPAAKLATALRGKASFLIGEGNDLAANHDQDGAYTLGPMLDLHYAYLVGLLGQGGWPDWNPNGTFVNDMADAASAHGVTPMFTLYAMAASGENNASVLTNDGYMKPYWDGARLLFQRLAVFGKPAVVQLEPDFWGYMMRASAGAKTPAHVGSLAPECAGMTNDVAGMGRCLVTLARMYAPKVAVGFHVSTFGGDVPTTVAFFDAVGARGADFITTDMLDRDAGCLEAHVDPNCQRGGTTGWYWDETNTTSPNFHEHLAWVKELTTRIGLPMLWWQIPLGVPSDVPGGVAGHYRDNRAHYLFGHVDEFIAAGGVGAVFGTGALNQTDIRTDGGQFKNAASKYVATPTALP